MRYPRVNLLNKNEVRYQGAVSGRFIAISAVAAPVFIVLLLFGVKVIQLSGAKSSLKESREVWSVLQPKYNSYKTETLDLSTSRTMVDMFNGWESAQLSFAELLSEVQLAVPGDIQLSRFSLRSKSAATSYLVPEDMNLSFSIVLEGQSFGASAEQHVFSMQRGLLDSKRIASGFESLEPEYIRKRESSSGTPVREFRLEGRAAEGGSL